MRHHLLGLALVSVRGLLSATAEAEEMHCKLLPVAGLLQSSYGIVGAEACQAACRETDGCKAWSYTPHTFNPKTAPGWCRLMEEVGSEEADERDYCGRV